jgi:16S rRNA (cytosine967-C5)-methyltransferase
VNVLRKRKKAGAARRLALEVLRRVEAEGAYASLALNHAFDRNFLSREDRALTTQLVYGTLRWRKRLDYALSVFSTRPLEKVEPVLLRILRLTAFQLLFLDRIPSWAAVDEACALAVSIKGKRSGGFVNAISRKLAATSDRIEWPDPEKNPLHYLSVYHSFPVWMVKMLLDRFGWDRSEKVLESLNQPAPVWIRANTLKGKTNRLKDLLTASGIEVQDVDLVSDALRISGNTNLSSLAAYEAGLFHVQDAAAQSICHLLGPKKGERVLDCCAAPGGKTATLAQLMGNSGQLVAVDRHPARLGLLKRLVERLGISMVERTVGDLTEISDGLGLFDRVLLDAPCTAMGVLRRHPEGKWRLLEEDLDRLAHVQMDLLEKAADLVKPGGALVYSVCTFSEEEGPGLIRRFLKKCPEYSIEDPRKGKKAAWHAIVNADGLLSCWPDQREVDGFFAVLLRRTL